jgi:hypothetical protein
VDNYDAPDARFFGQIIDEETSEPIPQDLIDGAVIEYIELGWENPPTQQLRFKVDGSFRNNLMFSGTYVVQPVRGNFHAIEKDTIVIKKGDNEYVMKTLPYVRIKDVELSLNADSSRVIATFKMEQTVSSPVKALIFLADPNPNVGIAIRTETGGANLGAVVDPDRTYTLQLRTRKLEKGKEYFFRVGALIDIPEAKYNFCNAIKMRI